MSNLFLDAERPLSTCSSITCRDCPVQGSLRCHFYGRDLARFMVIAFPPLIVGGIGIAHLRVWYLVPWIALFISYFGFIEIRVMCSHCPHYAEPVVASLKCWGNYGMPKLWKFRPGPMSADERNVFFSGLILIAGYPLAFLLAGMQWELLMLFILVTVVMAMTMRFRMCGHCMNFACPLNRVDVSMRREFLARNPVIALAWKMTSGG